MTSEDNAGTRPPSEMIFDDDVTIMLFWVIVATSSIYLLGQTFWYFPDRGALIASMLTVGMLVMGAMEYVR